MLIFIRSASSLHVRQKKWVVYSGFEIYENWNSPEIRIPREFEWLESKLDNILAYNGKMVEFCSMDVCIAFVSIFEGIFSHDFVQKNIYSYEEPLWRFLSKFRILFDLLPI